MQVDDYPQGGGEDLPSNIRKKRLINGLPKGDSDETTNQAPPTIISKGESPVLQPTVTLAAGMRPKREIKWIAQVINGERGYEWDPVLYPSCGAKTTDPPERTIRYSIFPRAQEEFEDALCAKFLNMDLKTEFPDCPDIELLQDDDLTCQVPETTVRNLGKQQIVDICFDDLQKAAIFSRVSQFNVMATIRNTPVDYKVTRTKVGICHEPDLITIEVKPALQPGQNDDQIEEQPYLDTVNYLLSDHPVLKVVAAWRQATKWNNGMIRLRPLLMLTVQHTLGFEAHTLPGFGNNRNFRGPDCDMAPPETIWFEFTYANRRAYCKQCKFGLHDVKKCPKTKCHECEGFGHVREVCPRRKTGNGGGSRPRGGRR